MASPDEVIQALVAAERQALMASEARKQQLSAEFFVALANDLYVAQLISNARLAELTVSPGSRECAARAPALLPSLPLLVCACVHGANPS